MNSRYKAQLIVKGFNKQKGVEFDEIFTLVVKKASIQVVLGLAATQNLKVEQMEVQTVFFHGEFKEEIYLEQPKGFKV